MNDRLSDAQKISIGAAQFGFPYGIANKTKNFNLGNINEIIRCAEKNKIDLIDTAILYGDSEHNLGSVGVSNFKVITKLPSLIDNQKDLSKWVNDQVDASLSRLKIKKLYGILLHKADDLLGPRGEELYKIINELKAQKTLKIGISIYDYFILDQVIDRFNIDIVQAPFNLFDRRMEKNGRFKKLEEKGIEIHIRSIFLQGLLLMNKKDIPNYFKRWEQLFFDYHRWLDSNKISPIDACISFLNQFKEINKIIIGIDSLIQLEEILVSSKKSLHTTCPEFSCEDLDLINPSNWKL